MYEKPERVLCLDIETTGLDAYKDAITMVGLWDGGNYNCIRNADDFASTMTIYHGWPILGHNIMFDLRFLLVKGWIKEIPKTVHDTQLMAHTSVTKVPDSYLKGYEEKRKELNKTIEGTHRPGKPNSLKVLAPWFLKVEPFWETPGNHDNEEYNKKDCVYTYDLFHKLWDLMDASELDFYHRRMLPWAKMCLDMQLTGINLDMVGMDTMSAELQSKATKLKEELDQEWMVPRQVYANMQAKALNVKYQEMAEKACAKTKDPLKTAARYNQLLLNAVEKIEPLNYSSPKQMAWLLKDYFGLDIASIDDEDEESTGKAVLNRLANEGRTDIAKYLEWRKTNKILTSFLPTYLELQVDGKLHPTFNITGTRTGRTSSSGPNLQQVPSNLYSLFKPTHGYKFIIYDLSGIEAALIALYSGDQKLYEILEKGESIHDHNAKALFNLTCPVSDVARLYPRERKTVKNIGFACFYGAGWRRISQVFAAGGFPITDAIAKAKLRNLKATYPGAFEFHEEITGVFEAGEVVENLFGRPLKIQSHENPYMQGFNRLIQSSASDLNLKACEKAIAAWAEKTPSARPLLVIHDCIVAEAKIEECVEAEKILVDAMTGFKLESVNGPIKLAVEGGVSARWEK